MKKGFTIIEVALVLAIGGLIFLMVFVAVPSIRAQQRNTSRRESIISFIDNVKKYQNNNRGALPTDWESFRNEYLGDRFRDPNGEAYVLTAMSCSANAVNADCENNELKAMRDSFFPNNYTMYVVTNATCSGDKAVRTKNPRKIAVLYILEGAGFHCNNS